MLKREITYKDFDGDEVTETFYFHLSKSELVELEVGYKDGIERAIRRIAKTNDREKLVLEFKRIILLAYGERSEDGRRFIKSKELSEAFSQTPAYDTLFMELATSDEAAAKFLMGIIPSDLAAEVEKSQLPPPNIQPAEHIRQPAPPQEVISETSTNEG